jgi:uncharacterized protein YndB with AHSA1/START domain
MPVTSIDKNVDDRSIVVTSDFAAPVERIWQLWSDARQLEKWWGPPTYPATVTDFELVPGGRVGYYMTSPEGTRFGGLWMVESVEEPRRLTFADAFADADGNAAEGMPVGRCVVELTERDGGTRMVTTTTYASAEDLEKVLAMGMEEGLTAAIGQIDDLLAAEAA